MSYRIMLDVHIMLHTVQFSAISQICKLILTTWWSWPAWLQKLIILVKLSVRLK